MSWLKGKKEPNVLDEGFMLEPHCSHAFDTLVWYREMHRSMYLTWTSPLDIVVEDIAHDLA